MSEKMARLLDDETLVVIEGCGVAETPILRDGRGSVADNTVLATVGDLSKELRIERTRYRLKCKEADGLASVCEGLGADLDAERDRRVEAERLLWHAHDVMSAIVPMTEGKTERHLIAGIGPQPLAVIDGFLTDVKRFLDESHASPATDEAEEKRDG